MSDENLKDETLGPAKSPEQPEPSAVPETAAGAGTPVAAAGGGDDLEKQVVDVLRTCYDPEIPVNIYELGLIYKVDVAPAGAVRVTMTLTSPMCPVAGSLPPEVEAKIRNVPGVTDAKVDVVWEPPWTPAMMSEAAKLQLNMM
ncbi:MAG TPA: SUF system Fe-S cluster assembly protein [Candidatus Polarisedimenticolia bacterium]|nr:SUF system Fe-S cluster assembly protein [Candidatus Polarisedimenticolia bacterium]